MTALVIYESMFGNTRAVAEAIADGLALHTVTELVEVSHAPAQLADDVDLVVLGAPTHAHGLSRPQTRASAAKEVAGKLVSPGAGIREWLAALPRPAHRVAVVAFDTRFAKARWMTGSAAMTIVKLARRAGFAVDRPAESFYLDHTLGPLQDGELVRARRFGELLADRHSTARR